MNTGIFFIAGIFYAAPLIFFLYAPFYCLIWFFLTRLKKVHVFSIRYLIGTLSLSFLVCIIAGTFIVAPVPYRYNAYLGGTFGQVSLRLMGLSIVLALCQMLFLCYSGKCSRQIAILNYGVHGITLLCILCGYFFLFV